MSPFPQAEAELSEIKSQAKIIFRRLDRNSEPQASIQSGQYTLQYFHRSLLAVLPLLLCLRID